MKNTYLIIMLLAGSLFNGTKGQNLVPNPSFENYTQCPDNWDQLSKTNNWTRYNTESPDYWNACDTSLNASVPYNRGGYQQAATGSAYIGIALSSGIGPNSYREYLGATLVSPLTIGTKYYISLKTSLTFGDTNFCKYACNNQCVLFTTTSYSPTNPLPASLNFAQLRNMAIITDTLNWTTLRWSLIADSAYQYIVLGNFYEDSLTSFLQVNISPSAWVPFAYYYFDDICVSTDSGTCETFTSLQELNGDEPVEIYPNPCSESLNVLMNNNRLLSLLKFEVFDISGKRIPLKNQKVNGGININTSLLKPGIYLLDLYFNYGNKKFLFIKN